MTRAVFLTIVTVIGAPMAAVFVIAYVLDEAAKVAETRRMGRSR